MDRNTPIREVKGVGPKSGELLEKKGLFTAGDLLTWYPRSYEVPEDPVPVADAAEGPSALRLYIIGNGSLFRKGPRTILHFQAADATGQVRLTFFNMPYLRNSLKPGSEHVFRGILRKTATGRLYMEQPSIYDPDEYDRIRGRIQPIYPMIGGLRRNLLLSLLREAAEGVPVPEFLPEGAAAELSLVPEGEAVRNIHLPETEASLRSAVERLIFDEFFLFILGVRREKGHAQVRLNPSPMRMTGGPERLIGALPYSLTQSQRRAWEEIRSDLCGDTVMYRLLQGDVGSGKTILAFLALLLCAENGRQGALMAPTEVLATQHMASLTSLIEAYGLDLHPVLLTGSVRGAARKEILRQIEDGTADVIIGTHALIQEKIRYSDLGLVITDEQHRFGVRQREILSEKGGMEDTPVLVMSATPIPRTLAIILYGELSVSRLTEMPEGRLRTKNLALPQSERDKALRFLYRQVREGRQAYVICPEIEEGETEGLTNVEDMTDLLQRVMPPEIRVELLHGRMKAAAKNEIMDRFGRGETDILVSTTVIEVGINVPNATVILIENAERFGLSQLHQLRGRVGRGTEQSYCIFLYGGRERPERLEVIEKTNDGFRIAEEDLRLRGPGDIFGQRQSGAMGFRLADVCEHAALMNKAAAYVDRLLAEDPAYECGALKTVDFRSI